MGWEDRRSGNQDRGDRPRWHRRKELHASMGHGNDGSAISCHHCHHHPHHHEHHHHAHHDDRRISHARLVLAQVMGRVALRASAAEGSWFFQSRSHISFSKIDSLSLSFSSSDLSSFLRKASGGFPLQCEFYTDFENFFWFTLHWGEVGKRYIENTVLTGFKYLLLQHMMMGDYWGLEQVW